MLLRIYQDIFGLCSENILMKNIWHLRPLIVSIVNNIKARAGAIILTQKLENLFKILFFIAATYLALTCFSRGAKKDLDFKVFHKVAERVVAGEVDLYNFKKDGIFSYKYSPMSALFFTPLSILPKEKMQVVWSFLNVIASILSFYLAILLMKHFLPKKQHDYNTIFLTLLMVSQFYINNAIQGNINAIIFLFMMASVYFVLVKGWNFLGALLLSFVIAIKIIPAAILGIFFFKKKDKAFFLTLLFVAIFFAAPFLYWDTEVATKMYHDWFLVLKDKDHFPFYKWTNQSPYAIWFYLTKSLIVAKMMSALHVLLAFALLLYSWQKRSDVLIISSCIFAMLLMPPVVWLEYHLILVFPLYYCVSYLFQGEGNYLWKALFFVRFIYAYAFSKLFFGRDLAEAVASSGQHYFSMMFLIVLVFSIPKEFQCGGCRVFLFGKRFQKNYGASTAHK